MPKKSRKKATSKQAAARNKFKSAISAYKSYKRANPTGKKKVQTFVKEAF